MPEANDRIAEMEQLIRQSKKQTHRLGVALTFVIVLLLIFVCFVGFGMWQINQTVSTAVAELPALIQTTEQSVNSTSADLETALAQVNAIDFEGLNESIDTVNQGLGNVDFIALSESIGNLQVATQRLAAVLSFFG